MVLSVVIASSFGGSHQFVERPLARVECVDDTGWLNRAGETEGEVPSARAQVSDQHAGSDIQRANDRVRVTKSILPRSAGIQSTADRAREPLKDHVPCPGISAR